MNRSSDTSRRPLWLCLHFPLLPLEIFTRGMTPEELQQPVVILERQRVALLNPAAMAAGIQRDNSMGTAHSLSSRLRSIERDTTREEDALKGLARWCYQFSPIVCIKRADALLLEISGCLALFGGLTSLTARIAQGLSELGYHCQAAHASTPLAALLLARAGRDTDSSSPESALLQGVPLTCMESDPGIIEALGNMGIHRMGDLLALPIDELGKRFGQEFVDYLNRLTGAKADPQEAVRPAPDFASEIHFLSDVTNTESLLFPMKRLLSELGDFLTARQLALTRFVWVLGHRNHGTAWITIRLASPENDRAMFLSLTQLQLERFTAMEEIDSLALQARRFSPARLATGTLFRNIRDPEDRFAPGRGSREEHMRFLNLLRARLGPDTCFGISLANDHRPERAWKRVRLDQGDYWHPPGQEADNPRPLYLLNPPRALREREGIPSLQGPLELLRGPERIDFGWWERDTPRDYYIARHGSGTLYWVCKHLNTGRWYLHGIFA